MDPKTRQNRGGYEATVAILPALLNPDVSVVPDMFASDDNDRGLKPEFFVGEIMDISM